MNIISLLCYVVNPISQWQTSNHFTELACVEKTSKLAGIQEHRAYDINTFLLFVKQSP